MNIELTSSNACRNARILSIEIFFSLMKSGKLVDFIKRKNILGVSGTLSDLYRPKKLDLSYDEYPLFDLESILNDERKTKFRFEKTHLPLLADVLQIPPMFKCSQGSVADSMEALCMLLKRWNYPCRYADMVPRFGRPIPVLSMITNQVLDFIYDTHGRRILQWNHDLLNPRSLEEYTYAVS